MIKHVERFHPELEVVSYVDTEVIVLEKGKIQVGIARVPNVGEGPGRIADYEIGR